MPQLSGAPLLVSLLACYACLGGDDKPRALLEMEKSRLRIRRADIQWSQVEPFNEEFTRGLPISYRSLIAERDIAVFNDGTPDGAAAFNEDGSPIPESRRAHLTRENDRWELETDWLKGEAWLEPPTPDRMVDPRTFGLLPIPKFMTSVARAVDDLRPDEVPTRRFRQREVNGIFVVEMEMTGCGHTVVWNIDPKLDWNPIRTELHIRGKRVLECVVEYERTGEEWFPSSASYYNFAGDLVNQVQVHQARINAPDLPDRLTPESIGFGNGVFVTVAAGPGAPRSALYASGERLLSVEEYGRLREAGKLESDPRIARRFEELKRRDEQARGAAPSATAPTDHRATVQRHASDDEWERYTLAFIARYALDVSQAQAALHVLRDCQERRTAVVLPRRRRAQELERRVLAARTDEERTAALDEVEHERAALNGKIDELFEHQLKPRLDRIPTRAQRQAVAGAAAPARP